MAVWISTILKAFDIKCYKWIPLIAYFKVENKVLDNFLPEFRLLTDLEYHSIWDDLEIIYNFTWQKVDTLFTGQVKKIS